MPLVRFEVRNEYGLGSRELYGAAEKKDDPKAILDGMAVSGLVGILRQLGDLAEFAAEIFHELQEQVMATASRSHKMVVRVQHLETALPPLEKVVFSQTNHIHFAYTAGSNWHPNHQTEGYHIVNSDLPPFIMDFYEECRDPPSLHMLDKFDSGGVGACLKRYSDPSFFERALVTSDIVNSEKSQLEKKTRRSKKNGVHQRNVGVPHAVIGSHQNGRTQFSSTNISRKNSIPRTTSMSRSEQEDRSPSLDSRGLGYIDCAFEVSSGIPLKEQEHHILTPSRLEMQCNETIASVHPHEQNDGANDSLPHQEKIFANSSSITWDEKTEILKSRSHKFDNMIEDQKIISELMPPISDQNKLERESESHKENSLVSFVEQNLSEGDESESETFVDALNTTATEIETDTEKQTGRGVEVPCATSKDNTECRTGLPSEMKSQSSVLLDVEPQMMPASHELCKSSEHLVLPKAPQIITTHSISNLNIDTDLSEVTNLHDLPNVNGYETSTSDRLSSGANVLKSHTSLSEKMINSVCNPEGSFAEVSGRSSINLWTNGGLLGLEPSKPSDYSLLYSENQNLTSLRNTNERGLLGENITPETLLEEPIGKLGESVMTSETTIGLKQNEERTKLPYTIIPKDVLRNQLVTNTVNIVQKIDPCECSTSGNDKKDNCLLGDPELSSSLSEAKSDKSKDSLCSSNFGNFRGRFTDTRVMTSGCDLPIVPDVCGLSREVYQNTKASSSSMFLPRLLVNSFQKKVSHDYRPEPTGTVEADLSEHIKHGSPTNSIASPPLEHMRISFYPIDGSETSKLELKFQDGHTFRDDSKDVIFPSFQLLPQSVIPLKDINFDSDEDTFSRSSEYMSDELLSEFSESNSEKWAGSNTPGSEDNEIYDALRRVSSAESISKSSGVEGGTHDGIFQDGDYGSPDINSGKPFHNGSPDINSGKPFHSGSPIHLQTSLALQFHDEPMPPPPPLPPLQWRIMKQQGDQVEENQGCVSEVLTYEFSQQAPVSSMSPQLKTTPPRQQPHIKESTTSPPESKNQELHKLNGHSHTKANQGQNGKIVDEKEDFLQQIRSRSVSLKRTVTARPASTPAPIADMKVTAILQKANAIRQAFVGSDEEDNGDWSE